MTELGDRVIGMGRALVAELEEESPGFRALRDGELSREGYIEFLVQHHKYARISYEMMKTYARRMGESENKAYKTTIHKGADNHAEEEKGHDDGILADLAVLWGCTSREALERVEAATTAPAIDLYLASVKTALERFPAAISGLAAVLECVGAAVARPALENVLAVKPFPGVERAVRWLTDHCEDGDHVSGGRLRIDLLQGARDVSAVQALAAVTAIHYREIWRFIDTVHGAHVAISVPVTARG
jgi:hypothetical protein